MSGAQKTLEQISDDLSLAFTIRNKADHDAALRELIELAKRAVPEGFVALRYPVTDAMQAAFDSCECDGCIAADSYIDAMLAAQQPGKQEGRGDE